MKNSTLACFTAAAVAFFVLAPPSARAETNPDAAEDVQVLRQLAVDLLNSEYEQNLHEYLLIHGLTLEDLASVVEQPASVNIRWSGFGTPRFVQGVAPLEQAESSAVDDWLDYANVTLQFLGTYSGLFRDADIAGNLSYAGIRFHEDGGATVEFQQVHQGFPVFGAGYYVDVDGQGRILRLNGWYVPSAVVSQDASAILSQLQPDSPEFADNVEQAVYEIAAPSDCEFEILDYEIGILASEVFSLKTEWVGPAVKSHVVCHDTGAGSIMFFDAQNLQYIDAVSLNFKAVRKVHYGDNDSDIPGQLIYRNSPYYFFGSWPGDAYQGYLGEFYTWRYWYTRFARDTWNDPGDGAWILTTDSTWPTQWAYWTDPPQAVFRPDEACRDSVAHEFGHAVVNSEIEEYGIYGGDQQFALSEGYADFFSAMTADDSPYGNDWLVGASCPIGTVRNMMNPPACGCGECPPEQSCAPGGDPDSFVNFIDVEQTHANAGIINKQNYLLAHDENPACVTHDQVEVCSIGTYDAEEMQYYIIQHDYLDHSADLLDYFYAMQSGAVALFGVPSYELTNTMRSLQAVGLWTKDYPASPTHDVDMAPDVAFFSETGNDMFMFYKKRSSNHILYRKYEGATASWGDAVDITTILSGAVTDNIPSAVEFNEDLYVFFKEDGQTAIQYVVMDSNETFDANVYTVPDGNCTYATATSDRVAVAEFDEKIYLVFRASNNYMRYRTMSAAGWNECATTTGYQTYVSPSAIGDWQDQLWIGYANSSYESRLLKLNSSGQKTAMVIPNSPNASKGIEVEIFKDELHVATVDGDGEIRYQRCSSPCTNTLVYPADGAHWSRLVKQHGGTLHRIAMTNYIGDYRLVMMGKDKTTGDTGYRYKISE